MWDIKYRPKTFAEVLGQEGSIKLLKARLAQGTAFDTNYIFEGGHGQGKTTLARIHARAMLCLDLNKESPEPCNKCENCQTILSEDPGAFSERDAASQGTIEHVRALVDELPFSVFNAKMRIYLFDEAHRMGTGAQDVLLKPLEENKMIGMFCTTEPSKIRGTIRSRCEGYTIKKVTREETLVRMKQVLAAENVEHEDDAVLTIIDYSGGHVRDILKKMEMVAQLGPLTLTAVRDALKLGVVSTYYEILLALGDAPKVIGMIDEVCERASPEDVATGLSEAAMNSYRLATGMFADFTYVDRNLGMRVYEKFGVHAIRLVEWFLRSRFVTKTSLLRDVVVLHHSPGNLPTEGAQPTILVSMGGAAPSSAMVHTPAPASPPTMTAPASTAAVPASPPALAVETIGAPTPSLDASSMKIPPLNELESKMDLDKQPLPRMVGHAAQHFVMPNKGSDEELRRFLQPDDWRREFEKIWPRGEGP